MNILSPVSDFEHLRLVSCAFTLLANQFNVGEELHLHRDRSVALAGLAPSSGNVERKMAGTEAALPGLGQRSKQVADGIKRLDISHGIRTRRPPDWRLIHQHTRTNE